ncbi:MAG: tetratricopeptide repeat protein, partial [Moraxellaceae bacterium]
MILLNTALIRKTTLFLAAAMLSVSAMATGFNENQRLANQGDADAQYSLGVMYKDGDGVRQDYS